MDMTQFEVRRITQTTTECRHQLICRKYQVENSTGWVTAWELHERWNDGVIRKAAGMNEAANFDKAVTTNKTSPVNVIELDGTVKTLDAFMIEHPNFSAYVREVEDKLNGR